MFKRIVAFLTPPIFEDEEQTRVASLLNTISLAILAMFVVFGATTLFTNDTPLLPLQSVLLGAAIRVGVLFLIQRGRTRLASVLLCSAFWVIITVTSALFGGISSPVVAGYGIVILTAGLLLGTRVGVIFTGLSILGVAGIFYNERSPVLHLPAMSVALASAGVTQTVILVAIAFLLYLMTRNLRDALARVNLIERAQLEANRQLIALRTTLDRRAAELERAQQRLYDSEKVYETLVENLPMSIFRKDLEGHYTFVNRHFCDEMGKSREEILGKTDFDFYPRVRAEQYRADDRQTCERGEVFKTIEEQPIVGGWGIYTQVVKTPTRDAEGSLTGIQGILWDITDQKRAELVLRQSRDELEKQVQARTAQVAQERNLLRTLIDNLPDAIYIKDSESRYLVSNPAHAKFLGLETPDQVVGKTVFDFFPPEFAAQTRADDVQVMQSGTPLINREERAVVAGTGKTLWNLTTKVPLRNSAGEAIGLLGISRDITERKQAEDALRESEERYRTILENIEDGYFEVDLAGNFTFFNDSLCKILGYSRDEMMGMNNRQYMDKENAQRVYPVFNRVYTTGMPGTLFDWEVVRKDGERRFNESSVSLMRDSKGERIGFRGIVRDITERKWAEAELRRRADEFAALHETTRDLATQQDLPTLLRSIVERAATLLAAPGGSIYLYDAARGDLEVMLSTDTSLPVGARLQLGEGMAGRVAQTREPLIVADYRAWPHRSSQFDGVPIRAVVEVPMLSGGELIGVLTVSERNDSTRQFTDADVRLLSLFAGQAASAVHNARLFEQTRQHAHEMQRLYELGRQLNSTLDLETVLQLVADAARELSGAMDTRVMFQIAPTSMVYSATSPATLNSSSAIIPQSTRTGGFTSTILQTGVPIILADATTDPRVHPNTRARGVRSLVGIPISIGSQTIGVLYANSRELNAFAAHTQELLTFLAAQAGIAIQNAHLFAAVQQELAERKRAEQETRQRNQELAALNQIGQALSKLAQPAEILELIFTTIGQVLDNRNLYIALYNEANQQIAFPIYTINGTRRNVASRAFSDGLTEYVIRTKTPLLLSRDVQEQGARLGYVAKGQPAECLLAVPLLAGDQVIGVMTVQDYEKAEVYNQKHVELLSTFAAQAAVALNNARLFATVQQELAERERAERETLQRNQELAALNQIGQALGKLAQPAEILELIFTMIGQVLDNRNFYIALYDEANRQISFPIYTIDGARQNREPRAFSDGLTEYIIRTKTPLLLTHDVQEQRARLGYAARGRPAKCLLAVPMFSGEKVIGVMTVQDYGKEEVYTQKHLELLSTFAAQAAVALDNAGLYATVQQELAERKRAEEMLRVQATRLQIAAEVARTVTSILDIEQILPRVADLIRERFGYYHAGVFLVDEKGEWAVLKASSSETVSHDLEGVMKLRVGKEGMIGFVAHTGQVRVAQDVAADAAYFAHPSLPATRSEAALPLKIGETTIGVFDVQSKIVNAFPPDAISILTTIADQIAIAIQNARLHAAEKQHAQELEQAYHSIQQNQAQLLISEKMASLGRLTAGIAHEMNTPLAAVRAALVEVERLINEYQTSITDADVTPEDHRGIAEEMRQSLQLASGAAERAATFVRGIKTQTRDLAVRESQRFNAVPVIRETLLLLGHTVRSSKCKTDFEPAVERVELAGSPSRLAQVITNLVTNAVDACADKGGGSISLRLTPRANEVELQVSDTGSGIPSEILPKIFEPMFTTKPFGQGTGLGLAIVHDIVVGEFGGTVQIASQIDQGTTFTLQFPKLKET